MAAYNKRMAKDAKFEALQTDVDAVKLDLNEIKISSQTNYRKRRKSCQLM